MVNREVQFRQDFLATQASLVVVRNFVAISLLLLPPAATRRAVLLYLMAMPCAAVALLADLGFGSHEAYSLE